MPRGKFYRLLSIVLCDMEQYNIPLVTFESRDVDGHNLSAKAMKALLQERRSIPVVLRVGAVDFKIGSIYKIRVGRDIAFGDALLELTGELEFKAITDDDGTLTGFEPSKYVYKKER